MEMEWTTIVSLLQWDTMHFSEDKRMNMNMNGDDDNDVEPRMKRRKRDDVSNIEKEARMELALTLVEETNGARHLAQMVLDTGVRSEKISAVISQWAMNGVMGKEDTDYRSVFILNRVGIHEMTLSVGGKLLEKMMLFFQNFHQLSKEERRNVIGLNMNLFGSKAHCVEQFIPSFVLFKPPTDRLTKYVLGLLEIAMTAMSSTTCSNVEQYEDMVDMCYGSLVVLLHLLQTQNNAKKIFSHFLKSGLLVQFLKFRPMLSSLSPCPRNTVAVMETMDAILNVALFSPEALEGFTFSVFKCSSSLVKNKIDKEKNLKKNHDFSTYQSLLFDELRAYLKSTTTSLEQNLVWTGISDVFTVLVKAFVAQKRTLAVQNVSKKTKKTESERNDGSTIFWFWLEMVDILVEYVNNQQNTPQGSYEIGSLQALQSLFSLLCSDNIYHAPDDSKNRLQYTSLSTVCSGMITEWKRSCIDTEQLCPLMEIFTSLTKAVPGMIQPFLLDILTIAMQSDHDGTTSASFVSGIIVSYTELRSVPDLLTFLHDLPAEIQTRMVTWLCQVEIVNAFTAAFSQLPQGQIQPVCDWFTTECHTVASLQFTLVGTLLQLFLSSMMVDEFTSTFLPTLFTKLHDVLQMHLSTSSMARDILYALVLLKDRSRTVLSFQQDTAMLMMTSVTDVLTKCPSDKTVLNDASFVRLALVFYRLLNSGATVSQIPEIVPVLVSSLLSSTETEWIEMAFSNLQTISKHIQDAQAVCIASHIWTTSTLQQRFLQDAAFYELGSLRNAMASTWILTILQSELSHCFPEQVKMVLVQKDDDNILKESCLFNSECREHLRKTKVLELSTFTLDHINVLLRMPMAYWNSNDLPRLFNVVIMLETILFDTVQVHHDQLRNNMSHWRRNVSHCTAMDTYWTSTSCKEILEWGLFVLAHSSSGEKSDDDQSETIVWMTQIAEKVDEPILSTFFDNHVQNTVLHPHSKEGPAVFTLLKHQSLKKVYSTECITVMNSYQNVEMQEWPMLLINAVFEYACTIMSSFSEEVFQGLQRTFESLVIFSCEQMTTTSKAHAHWKIITTFCSTFGKDETHSSLQEVVFSTMKNVSSRKENNMEMTQALTAWVQQSDKVQYEALVDRILKALQEGAPWGEVAVEVILHHFPRKKSLREVLKIQRNAWITQLADNVHFAPMEQQIACLKALCQLFVKSELGSCELPQVQLMLCTGVRILETSLPHMEMNHVWMLNYVILSRSVKQYSNHLSSMIYLIMQGCQGLLRKLLQTDDVQAQYMWSMNLGRLFGYLRPSASVVRKYVVFLLLEYFNAAQEGISLIVQRNLRNGMYCLMEMCSKHELAHVHIALHPVGQTLFKSSHAEFKKIHQYSGNA